MKKILLFVVLTFLAWDISVAQNINGQAFVCPNGLITQTYSLNDPRACDQYQWTIEGPSSAYTVEGNKTSKQLKLKFWDNGNFKLTLSITNPGGQGCDNIFNGQKAEFHVQAGYGSAPSASDITQNRSAVCGKKDAIVFSTKAYYGAKYKWIIPTGWSSSNLNQRTITVTPSGNSGGTVRVDTYFDEGFLYNEDCIDNYDQEFHHPLISKNVGLINPSLSDISGPQSVSYGSKTPLTYSVSPQLSGAGYRWTLPCDWKGPGGAQGEVTTTTNSIVVTPSGYNAGSLKVKATLRCGSSDYTTPQKTINIGFSGGNPYSISGASTLCSQGQSFTLNRSLPSGSTVTWSTSSNITQVSGQGTGTYTAKPINSLVKGSGWIRATISGSCGNTIATKTVWVGTPQFNEATIMGNSSVTCQSIYIYDLNGTISGDDSFVWETSGHFDNISNANTYEAFLQPEYRGEGYVSLKATNSCGSAYICKSVTVASQYPCGPGLIVFPGSHPCASSRRLSMVVYPNPSSDYLTIKLQGNESEIQTKNENAILSEELEVSLYDFNQQLIYSSKMDGNTHTLDIRDIKKGYYILKVYDQNMEIINQTIAID